jgi:cell division protease FtsH
MVVRWGMSPKVGPLNFGDADGGGLQQRPYSEATAALIDAEVRRIAEECLADAERLLTEHRAQLDALAHSLLKNDSLNEKQILEVTGLDGRDAGVVGQLAGSPTN